MVRPLRKEGFMSTKFQAFRARFINSVSPKKDLMNLFMWLMGVSAAVYFVVTLIIGNGSSSSMFFLGGDDFFMDCFNQIRDSSQGKEVYSERHVIYPPMANLIFLILSRFTSDAYNDSIFGMRYSWKVYGSSLAFLMIVLAVCFIATFALVLKYTKRDSMNRKMVFAAMATLSVPMLYMLERGNMLIICVIALLIYGFTYNSDSKVAREIGLLALAFSFSVKLYPVVFGWFLIADKRFKEAIRCAIYGVAMLILPSFFFGGPIFCVRSLYENITGWSSGSGNGISQAMKSLNFSEGLQSVANGLIYLWVFICAACFVISPFIRPDKPWKTWAVGLITILCVPSLTGIYGWVFVLIPLMMLVNDEKPTGRNLTYLFMITVPFMFLPLNLIPVDVWLGKLLPMLTIPSFSLAKVWNYVVTAVVAIFMVVDTFVDLGSFLSRRKKTKQSALSEAQESPEA